MSITIQTADFTLADEYQALRDNSQQIGAIVTFCGLVRDFDQGNGQALFLEHYPGMTENLLLDITKQAKQRWPINDVRIVHRVGTLALSEQIVFVGVSSPHRGDAFHACEFIIDFLKTHAPFWKKALTDNGEYWVEAKDSDQQQQRRWLAAHEK
jgi:molybdopterin synthase catalytic subunit